MAPISSAPVLPVKDTGQRWIVGRGREEKEGWSGRYRQEKRIFFKSTSWLYSTDVITNRGRKREKGEKREGGGRGGGERERERERERGRGGGRGTE